MDNAKIAEDVLAVITPSYQVEALLLGASKLLEGNGDREVWAAHNIIEAALKMVRKVYTQYDDLDIGKRIAALEDGLACPPVEVEKSLAEKPGPTMENTDGATNCYDLACEMSGELSTLRDLLEIAADRAYAGKDGKLVSLFVSAMPKMSKAVEICERLELAA